MRLDLTVAVLILNQLIFFSCGMQTFENFRLPKREGVQVGYFNHIELVTSTGRKDTIITRSLNPAIFEVPAYFSPEECEYLIMMAKNAGLQRSPLQPTGVSIPDIATEELFHEWDVDKDGLLSPIEFTYIKGKGDLYLSAADVSTMFRKLRLDKDSDGMINLVEFLRLPLGDMKVYLYKLGQENPLIQSRNSNQTWLWHYGAYNDLLESFHERLSRLTLIPHDVIEMSEPMQIVSYNGEGHFHCHHDSDEVDERPCCTYQNQKDGKCRLCRYITVMFFLSNVTEGGELVFQIADNATYSKEDWALEAVEKCNVVTNCAKGNLVIKPKQGTALMWYNHDVDSKTGMLGELNPMSVHGGCEVRKGAKWIANNWINIIGQSGSEEFKSGWLKQRLDHDEL
ncbi:transmembrane prolyl 4-hydroxylase-like [Rhopilema esculentum]|uniref:transmembrane prolyl 4-hydroxylase-like n=1 Tax=Rhopilema esculentum TaxID=499914 RepID=UPI0031D18023|eukprot:gene4107-20289_t